MTTNDPSRASQSLIVNRTSLCSAIEKLLNDYCMTMNDAAEGG